MVKNLKGMLPDIHNYTVLKLNLGNICLISWACKDAKECNGTGLPQNLSSSAVQCVNLYDVGVNLYDVSVNLYDVSVNLYDVSINLYDVGVALQPCQ